MRNIPADYDKYQVKAALANHLHAPRFFNRQANFDVVLYRVQNGATDRAGVFTVHDVDVGNNFLTLYGTERPSMFVFCGPNRLSFSAGRREPSPDLLESISRSTWVDPSKEREREQREKQIDAMFVALQSIQFGWMCRDDVYSIESEARQTAFLRFDSHRRELNVVVKEAYNDTSEYVIAIRPPSILGLSCHRSSFDGQTVIFLQLEIPPVFFHRPIAIPGAKKPEPYIRMDKFPVVNNPSAIPYTSLALRLVLLSPSGAEAFAILSDVANLRNITKSYPVEVARRKIGRAHV